MSLLTAGASLNLTQAEIAKLRELAPLSDSSYANLGSKSAGLSVPSKGAEAALSAKEKIALFNARRLLIDSTQASERREWLMEYLQNLASSDEVMNENRCGICPRGPHFLSTFRCNVVCPMGLPFPNDCFVGWKVCSNTCEFKSKLPTVQGDSHRRDHKKRAAHVNIQQLLKQRRALDVVQHILAVTCNKYVRRVGAKENLLFMMYLSRMCRTCCLLELCTVVVLARLFFNAI